ncbi:MAG: HyaD/HybD family hydrogenase maturation endopeptidase [Desulfuromonadaceae bacterium]|nr:HyaD/HybD family hydrogenase maturation endopeptidase [Desulfuromonadaceae bacterium]MDD2856848.1 HyaD/HybD family hydrogenase maturation endopeptidase [Desulfuromonadaceae bacterium]
MYDAATENSVLILGVGNLVMTDDAVGVIVVQKMVKRYRFPDNVEVMDGGTLGLDLLHKLENISKLIMIDAVETGKEAGNCVRLAGDELPIALLTKVSPHQMGLKDLLAVSELMGHSPKEMVLFGVQPASVEMGVGLTEKVEAQVETLISSVLYELSSSGIDVSPI